VLPVLHHAPSAGAGALRMERKEREPAAAAERAIPETVGLVAVRRILHDLADVERAAPGVDEDLLDQGHADRGVVVADEAGAAGNRRHRMLPHPERQVSRDAAELRP